MQIKVLSWNIWLDGDFEKVTAFLHSANADIIGLQEVVPGDKSRDIVSFLSALGYESAITPIGAAFPDGRMITVGVFSRHPIQEVKLHRLSEESDRQFVEARIKVGSTVLYVFSVHLVHTHQKDSALQTAQAEHIVRVLPQQQAIVMGDFNATPSMTPIQQMRKELVDTDPESQPTWSLHPEGCVVCKPEALDTRLDYIFASKDLKTHSFKVENAQGSDHLPISVAVNTEPLINSPIL